MFSIVPLVLSGIAIILSFYAALKQIGISRKANSLPLVIDLFREYRCIKFKEHQDYVFNELRNKYSSVEHGISNLPKDARDHVRVFSFFFNNLGVLVYHKLADIELIISYMGGNIIRSWEILRPYIEKEIDLRGNGSPYQGYFRRLAFQIKNHPKLKVLQS
jgi:hypothetical protein